MPVKQKNSRSRKRIPKYKGISRKIRRAEKSGDSARIKSQRARSHARMVKALGNPPVKMQKVPKGWIKAKAVRVVTRNGKKIVEVKR